MDSWNAVLTNPAKKFFAKSAKLFCSKCDKNIKLEKSFSKVYVSPRGCSGHVECSFNNLANNFFTRRKLFNPSRKNL